MRGYRDDVMYADEDSSLYDFVVGWRSVVLLPLSDSLAGCVFLNIICL
jgi:hypothetical protein